MRSVLGKAIIFSAFIALVYFPIFGHLEAIPIRVFDEARPSVNAFEMSRSGNLIVTTFEGEPDMWNTKPPLLIWLQALGIKIFGAGEFSVRLPSAIGALLTCLFLVYFAQRVLCSYWFGIIAVVVLTSTYGYIHVHAVRTGDYDSLLTLFTTIYPLLFFLYVETDNRKLLFLSIITISFAILTKGVAGIIFLPVLGFYTIIRGKGVDLIKAKQTYLAVAFVLITSGGYYLLREVFNPGFLSAVWANELGGRYLQTVEGHKAGFWFYYRMLVDHHLVYWSMLVPCGVVVGILSRNGILRRLTLYSTGLVVFHFLIISCAKTKLEWYTVPLYPYFALLAAIFIYSAFDFLREREYSRRWVSFYAIPFIFLFLIVFTPVRQTLRRVINPKEYSWDVDFYHLGYFFKEAIKGKHDLNGYGLLYDGYYAHNLFYVYILQDKNIDIKLVKEWRNPAVGGNYIVNQQQVKDYLDVHFRYEIIYGFHNVQLIKITAKHD